jgi:hypothetical protein
LSRCNDEADVVSVENSVDNHFDADGPDWLQQVRFEKELLVPGLFFKR